MPRFAGLTPLEPVKTEILTPTPVQNVSSPSNSSQKETSDIPTVQFDWNGSGLVNPLDCKYFGFLEILKLIFNKRRSRCSLVLNFAEYLKSALLYCRGWFRI